MRQDTLMVMVGPRNMLGGCGVLGGIAVLALFLRLSLAGAAIARSPIVPDQPPPAAGGAPDGALDAAQEDLSAFLRRAAGLRPDDVEGRLTLARWARDRRMWEQARDMAGQVLAQDPGNRAAYQILQLVDEARPLPEEPQVEKVLKEEFARRFGREFNSRNSRHFILVYDTTDAFAAGRGVIMEKTYDAFQFYFNMSTLRPEFLEKRLVVVLLRDREDYLTYIRETERTDLAWSAGYYSQRSNRSVFFDEASGQTAASFARESAALRAKIDDLNRQISRAQGQNQRGLVNTLTAERNRAGRALATANARMGNAVAITNNSKTMHEAAHHLAFNLGIQTRFVDYPMWLSEGLASAFEMEDADGRRGPVTLNPGRIAVLKEALRDGRLMPIADFISADPSDTSDDEALSRSYAQAWALFHYLYRFHRDGMEKYLRAYQAQVPMRPIGVQQREALFTQAFGDDLDGLNSRFMAYVRALPGRPP